MSGVEPKLGRYRFGPFELDTAEGSLSRNGSPVRLQDLPYRLLVMLVERQGEIITREEVRQRLWPENTFVEFDNSLGVAIRKVRDSLNDEAETPRYVETLTRRGYRFVAPVTVLEPDAPKSERPPLQIIREGSLTVAGASDNASTKRRRFFAIAASALVFAGIAVYWFGSGPSTKATAVSKALPVRARRSVAVLGFRNLAGRPEDGWLSLALAEMLNTELAAGGDLRMVSGEDVARVKRELPLTDEESLAKGTLQRLGINPGADIVVLGSYTLLPGKGKNLIRLDIRIQDTAGGETLTEQAFAGDEADLFNLASRAGSSLRQNLGVSSSNADTTSATRYALPSTERAAKYYAEGRAKLWAYDFAGARDLLVKAVAADPHFSLAHSALSEALWHSGYEVKARSEALRARELDNQLPQEQRLLVEGQYRRSISDWPKAVEAYQSLYHSFPDSLDYGLLLASAQMSIKRGDALQTLASLRRIPPPSGEDARIDMLEASAWINIDLTKARAGAKRAIEKAKAQGSYVLEARTYGILCQQGSGISSSAEAMRDCENALQDSIAAKDPNSQAMMRLDLAVLHYQMGELTRSEGMFRAAIDEFRKVGNLDGVATAMGDLGSSLLSQGDLKAAKNLIEGSILNYQAIEDREGIALALNDLGDLFRQKGNLGEAETTYGRAEAMAHQIEDKRALGYVLNGIGDLYMDRGDLAAARKSYQESLAFRDQNADKQASAESQVALAQLSIEEGHPVDGEIAARRCRRQFHDEHQTDDELEAGVVLVRTLLAQNKIADAQKELDEIHVLAEKSQNRFARLQFEITSARVRLTSIHPESARPQLERTLREARSREFVGIEFEARLALSELAKKSRSLAPARDSLLSLQRAAHAKGFDLIARKAASQHS